MRSIPFLFCSLVFTVSGFASWDPVEMFDIRPTFQAADKINCVSGLARKLLDAAKFDDLALQERITWRPQLTGGWVAIIPFPGALSNVYSLTAKDRDGHTFTISMSAFWRTEKIGYNPRTGAHSGKVVKCELARRSIATHYGGAPLSSFDLRNERGQRIYTFSNLGSLMGQRRTN